MLASDSDIAVVGECADGPSAVRRCRELRPDVVVMDVEMPGGDGLTATRRILSDFPDTKVLVLTTFDLDEYVIEALRAGASGFLLKTTPPRELTAAVKSCAAGDTRLGPTVIDRLVDSYLAAQPTVDPRLPSLTERETDVLRAMARGLSNAEIAGELFLAETTVKTHVARILNKLGVRDRLQAVVIAHNGGLR